jgi:hypothetical protein
VQGFKTLEKRVGKQLHDLALGSEEKKITSIAGRPSAAPESKTPCLRPSASTSWLTSKVMFLVVSPSLSASGPSATNLSPIAV